MNHVSKQKYSIKIMAFTELQWKSVDYFLATSSRRVEVIFSRLLEYRGPLSILVSRSMWRGGAEEWESKNASAEGR